MTEFAIRPITEEERTEFRRLMGLAFFFDPSEEGRESFNAILEMDRTVAAFDGRQMVGTAGAFSFEMTVPGGVLPTAGTTMVTVLATHRRRGALRQMMRIHLEEVRERGEMLAALWASESSIYGRFGYGPAAGMVTAELERRHVGWREPPQGSGSVRLVDVDEAKRLLPAVFQQTRHLRPGIFDRSETWWENEVFRDPENQRDGATSYRYAVYEEDGKATGYVQYRAKEQWEGDFPNGEVRISELQAADLAAADGLWRFVASIDLIGKIKYWNLPVDDPLPWLLSDPRRLKQRISESVWVCPIDIPQALAGRKYSRAGKVVLEVKDEFNTWNNGTFLLETDGEEATCAPTSAAPDLVLTASDLGAVYLGGVRLLNLAAAGRVEGSIPDLQQADSMFSWHPAPWCPQIF